MGKGYQDIRIELTDSAERPKELSDSEVLVMRYGILVCALVLLGWGLWWSYPIAILAPDPLEGLLPGLASALSLGVSFVVFPILIGTILIWYAFKWPQIPAQREAETISISQYSYIAPQWLNINPYAILSFVVGLVYIWFGSCLVIAFFFVPIYPSSSPAPKHVGSAAVSVSLIITAGVRRCILAVKRGRMPIGWEISVTYSNYLPIWRLVVMSLITCGIYHLEWFADVSEHLKKHLQLRLRPGWRALGIIVPVCNSILVYQCFRYINQAADKADVKRGHSPLFLTAWYTLVYAAMIYVLVFQWHSALWAVTVSLLALVIAGTCLLAVVQATLNAIWLREQRDLPARDSFSKNQWSLVVCGWLTWSLIAHFLPGYWPG